MSAPAPIPPRVLLVDDEERVLQAYARVLRARYAMDTATSGAQALELMAARPAYAVLVSDMRMPRMTGVELLAEVKSRHPETVRVMITGNADQDTAIEAVNRGEIFRFLSKPCEPERFMETLDQAIRQHELLVAEKVLLEGTLKGSIRMLVDLLSLLDPICFGRAQELGELAEAVAREMGMENPWILGIAAVLSQIGMLTLPEGVATKIQAGTHLNTHEREMANRVPETGAELIRNIPRLEEVAEAVLYMNKNVNGSGFPEDDRQGDAIPLGGRILRAVWDYERLQPRAGSELAVLREMAGRSTWYDPEVLRALGRCLNQAPEAASASPRSLGLHELRKDQVIIGGIETLDGLLVLPAGTRLTLAHLQKLRNFARLSGLREPIQVLGSGQAT